MLDFVFTGLKILRDAWKYVRDLKENIDTAQTEVKRIKGHTKYIEDSCRTLAVGVPEVHASSTLA